MRLPFSVMTTAISSLYVGALDAAVEMTKGRMRTASGVNSPPRIERPMARMRWVNAFQTARMMHLIRDAAIEDALEVARRGVPQTLEEEAMNGLHGVHGEYDVLMDRHARWLLGMGLAPGDPGARMT